MRPYCNYVRKTKIFVKKIRHETIAKLSSYQTFNRVQFNVTLVCF